MSLTYSNPWKEKGGHRWKGHNEKACAEGGSARVGELQSNMMLATGEACDDMKIK